MRGAQLSVMLHIYFGGRLIKTDTKTRSRGVIRLLYFQARRPNYTHQSGSEELSSGGVSAFHVIGAMHVIIEHFKITLQSVNTLL